MDSLPAASAAWPVKVFKCNHQSKHRGKGGGDRHQLRPQPRGRARPYPLPSMHSPQHWRKHRGRRGGIKHQLRYRPHEYSISILLSSVHVFDNKLDGLLARVSFQRGIRCCGVFSGEVWPLLAVFCHCAAHRDLQAGQELRLPPRAQQGTSAAWPVRPLGSWMRTLPKTA